MKDEHKKRIISFILKKTSKYNGKTENLTDMFDYIDNHFQEKEGNDNAMVGSESR